MDESSVKLKQWIDSTEAYEPASWERLPELELYMDQVLTFMNRQLEPFSPDKERLLTPSMINNYVKDGVLPRPVRKKYSRGHLAMLMMICSLKTVLSLPEISSLLNGLTELSDISELYPEFAKAHGDAITETSSCIADAPGSDRETLYRMALKLALEANERRTAAASIINSLENPPVEKEKDKSKD